MKDEMQNLLLNKAMMICLDDDLNKMHNLVERIINLLNNIVDYKLF